MSDSEEYEYVDAMDPEGYDVAQGAMYKMAKQFNQNQSDDEELAEELDNLIHKSHKKSNMNFDKIDQKYSFVKVNQKDALEAQSKANHDLDDQFEEVSSDEIDELENELEKDNIAMSNNQSTNIGIAPKNSITDKIQTYESDDNDLMAQLHKLETQDDSFKINIMKQNKQDEQKAEIVKQQKNIFEGIIGQRMSIQKYINKVNQLPQTEIYEKFHMGDNDKFEELEQVLKENITELNDL